MIQSNFDSSLVLSSSHKFIDNVQKYLYKLNIDGWMLYDCEGLNPIAEKIIGDLARLLSRRWFYFIPISGQPIYLFHKVEQIKNLQYPGKIIRYHNWQEFEEKLKKVLLGKRKIAVEYSSRAAIPSLSKIDAGTMELIRACQVTPVSSAELIQYFFCKLSSEELESHLKAVSLLYTIRDKVISSIKEDFSNNYFPTEYQVQQRFSSLFEKNNLISDFPPIVAVNNHSGNPHYQPTSENSAKIKPNSLLLLDFWARLRGEKTIYGDITWMFYTGSNVPDEYQKVFEIVINARDAAVDFLQHSFQNENQVKGFQIDNITRKVITDAGYGNNFTHRTGHNLGKEVHGQGANLDNLETHEERFLIPKTAFTIEPGIYLEKFGCRSEIDVYYDEKMGFTVTTPKQFKISTF